MVCGENKMRTPREEVIKKFLENKPYYNSYKSRVHRCKLKGLAIPTYEEWVKYKKEEESEEKILAKMKAIEKQYRPVKGMLGIIFTPSVRYKKTYLNLLEQLYKINPQNGYFAEDSIEDWRDMLNKKRSGENDGRIIS
jgi:hypothetical protein